EGVSRRRARLSWANDPVPLAVIDRTVLAEQASDVMTVGAGAHDVRQRLEASRLWLDLKAIQDDMQRDLAAIQGHPWKKAYADWKASSQVQDAEKIPDSEKRRECVKRLYLDWLKANDQAALRLRNHFRTRRGQYQSART